MVLVNNPFHHDIYKSKFSLPVCSCVSFLLVQTWMFLYANYPKLNPTPNPILNSMPNPGPIRGLRSAARRSRTHSKNSNHDSNENNKHDSSLKSNQVLLAPGTFEFDNPWPAERSPRWQPGSSSWSPTEPHSDRIICTNGLNVHSFHMFDWLRNKSKVLECLDG